MIFKDLIAKFIEYNNNNSGLDAKNVQDAIDELNTEITTIGGTYAIRQIWENITTNVSGTITTYANTTIIEDEWTQEEDALVVEIIDGKPTEKPLIDDKSGEIIYADIDSEGHYTLSGIPQDGVQFALIWEVGGQLKYLSAIPQEKIIMGYDLDMWAFDGTNIRTRYQRNIDIQNKNILNVGNIQFDTSYGTSGDEPVGTEFWNGDEHCKQIVYEYGAKLNVGFELWKFGTDEGNNFPEGSPVSVKGVSGNRVAFELTDASSTSSNAEDYMGLLTTAVDSGNRFVTREGDVNGIDTTGATFSYGGLEVWDEGNTLYVDPLHAGYMTKIKPQAPNKTIKIGKITIKHSTQGQISLLRNVCSALADLCDVNGTPLTTTGQILVWDNTRKVHDFNYNFLQSFEITKEPTGFDFPENVVIIGDTTNRIISLSGSGYIAYYRNKIVPELVSGWISPQHGTDTTKTYFLYYDGNSFIWVDASTLSEDFYTNLMICFTFYDNTNSCWVYLRECHGLMQWQSHKEDHDNFGTYRKSGGEIGDFFINSTTERRPSVSSTLIYDEDLPTTLQALASGGNYTQFYLSGANGDSNFITTAIDIVPLSTNNPYYNQFTGGAWQQTLLSNNYIMSIWVRAIPVVSDSNSQKYKYLFLQGQWQSANIDEERAKNIDDLSLGVLQSTLPEGNFIARLIIRFIGGDWRPLAIDRISGTNRSQVSGAQGNYLSSVSVQPSLTGLGTPESLLGINFGNANTWSATQTFNANVAISGNLTVQGDIISQDVKELVVEDSLITLNNGETDTGITYGRAGLMLDRGLANPYGLWFDEAYQNFRVGEFTFEYDTAQSATLTTIVLSASASAVDDYYNGKKVKISEGTGSGQVRIITDYDGTTKTATVSDWDTIPDATSVYEIITNDYTVALAGRENTPNNDGIGFWNSTSNILETSANFTYNGTNLLLQSTDLGATGTRVNKGWFSNLEITNYPSVNGTALTNQYLSTTNSPTFANITTTTNGYIGVNLGIQSLSPACPFQIGDYTNGNYSAEYTFSKAWITSYFDRSWEQEEIPTKHYASITLNNITNKDTGGNLAGSLGFTGANEFGGYNIMYAKIGGARLDNFYGGFIIQTMHNRNDGILRGDLRLSNGTMSIGSISESKSALNIYRDSQSVLNPSDVYYNNSIVLTNKLKDDGAGTPTPLSFIAGGLLIDTYRDIASNHYSAGIWFTRDAYVDNFSSRSDIVFGCQGSNSANNYPAERMRILGENGNVGIGTTTPSEKLEVDGQVKAKGVKILEQSQTYTGASIDWNVAEKPKIKITLTQNSTLNYPSNTSDGGVYIISIKQGATPYTLSFGSGFYWDNNIVPTLNAAEGDVDCIVFYKTDGKLIGKVVIRSNVL